MLIAQPFPFPPYPDFKEEEAKRKEMESFKCDGKTFISVPVSDNDCTGCYYLSQVGCPMVNCDGVIFKLVGEETQESEEKESITMQVTKVRMLQSKAVEEERKEAEKIAIAHLRKINREIASAEANIEKLKAKRQELLDRDIMEFLIDQEKEQ